MHTTNKFDNVYSKLVSSSFEKIGLVIFHQINLMKKSQSKLKSPREKEKSAKIKLQMNEY